MSRKSSAVVAITAALVVVPLLAPGQKPGKVTTIGFLRSGARADTDAVVD